jgi:phage-related protein
MATDDITFVGKDQVSGIANQISDSLGNIGARASGVGDTIKGAFSFVLGGAIQAGIGAITGSVGGLVDGMISGNAQFERYQTQFGVLLGGADAAKARLDDLAKFGASTPFELPQVVEADKILQGFGLHSEEAAKKFGFSGTQIRTIAGDVASGVGVGFDEMSLLLGKFASGATGEAISRMQELGITTREEMAGLGLEFSKSGELLSPLPESMNVVLKLMEGKYGGMMDAQSKTFEGMVSNAQDWVAGTLRTLGQPIFETVKDKLQGVLTFLGSPEVQTGITNFATTLAEGIGGAIEFITPVIEGVAGTIGQFAGTIKDIAGDIMDGFSENGILGAISNGAGRIAELFGMGREQSWAFGDGVAEVARRVGNVIQTMGEVFAQVFELAQSTAQRVWPTVERIIGLIGEIFSTVFGEVGTGSTDMQKTVEDVWAVIEAVITVTMTVIESAIRVVLGVIKGIFRGDWSDINKIVDEAISALKTLVDQGMAAVKGFIQDRFNEAIDFVKGLPDQFVAFGKGIIEGIAQGIRDGAQAVKNALTDFLKRTLPAWAIELLGIASPSKVFADIGKQIPAGLAVGILGGAGQVYDALQKVTTSAGAMTMRGAMGAGVSASFSMGGDTFNVAGGMDVARQINDARRMATRQAMLRAQIG